MGSIPGGSRLSSRQREQLDVEAIVVNTGRSYSSFVALLSSGDRHCQ